MNTAWGPIDESFAALGTLANASHQLRKHPTTFIGRAACPVFG